MSEMDAPTRTPSTDAERDSTKAPKGGLKKFSYSFFDPEIAHLRALYIKIVASSVILLIFVVWACLPVYWGSLWKAPVLTKNLRAWVVDRDGGPIGTTVSGAIMGTLQSGSKQILGWQQIEAAAAGNDDEISNAVVEERTWVAVVIEQGASQRLVNARANGDATYNASQAISVYIAQGRNEIAVGSFVLPIINGLLGRITAQIGAQATAQYLGSIVANQTAIGLLARAPQTVSQPVFYTIYNIRPYSSQVASAVTLVGQIYIIILGFFVTMAGGGAREIVAPYLTTKSLIKLRIAVPLILYFPLSLVYAMISLPFKLPFGAKYSYAAGFFLFWMLVYVGMCALGLATEAAFTLLTPRFVAFFLIPYIVINVSVTVLPNELQPWFYKYGLGFPVYNMSQAVRTIIFNTKNHLGRNFGVLIAWTVLSMITVPLFQWFMRRGEIAAEQSKVLLDENAEMARESEERQEYGRGTTARVTPALEKQIEEAENLDRIASRERI